MALRQKTKINMDDGQPAGRIGPHGPETGLTTKIQFSPDGTFGPRIHMYNAAPGVYYDANGFEVPAVVAKKAGFDIEMNMALQSYVGEMNRLRQRAEAVKKPKGTSVVEQVRPLGHTLVRVGDDAYHIEDKDGVRVTSTEQPRSYAVMWLDDIDPMLETPEEEFTVGIAGEPALVLPTKVRTAEPFGFDPKEEAGNANA